MFLNGLYANWPIPLSHIVKKLHSIWFINCQIRKFFRFRPLDIANSFQPPQIILFCIITIIRPNFNDSAREKTYAGREINRQSEISEQHGHRECSDEWNQREEEHIWNGVRDGGELASGSVEGPVAGKTGITFQTPGMNQDFVLERDAFFR